MKAVKRILIGIVAVIVIILIAALFIKKDYTVERSIVINKAKPEVFDYIKILRNQDNYSKWAMMDPSMKKEYRGVDGFKGFVSAWDSNDKHVGKGEQEIIDVKEGERIDFEIRFMKPFKAVAKAYMTAADDAVNTTKVTWVFEGNMNYPMNFMLPFMNMDKMLGDDLETGLTKLKSVLENR